MQSLRWKREAVTQVGLAVRCLEKDDFLLTCDCHRDNNEILICSCLMKINLF